MSPSTAVSARSLAMASECRTADPLGTRAVISRDAWLGSPTSCRTPFLHRTWPTSDVLWDRVVGIEDLGDQPVFDATVEGTHNYAANGIIIHNSIEQDSDVVMFIYRDAIYDREKVDDGDTELLVAKHRNGPTGTVHLTFIPRYAKFEDGAKNL